MFPPAPPASDTCAERCRELKMGEFAPSGTGWGGAGQEGFAIKVVFQEEFGEQKVRFLFKYVVISFKRAVLKWEVIICGNCL